MNTVTIRELLHNYIKIADTKTLRTIYAMVKDDIGNPCVSFSTEEKQELDRRMTNYLQGGKIVSPLTMSKRIQALRSNHS